jgi:flagellar biosynthesis/type III secretory pathway M-ring protein FliF/YscJ
MGFAEFMQVYGAYACIVVLVVVIAFMAKFIMKLLDEKNVTQRERIGDMKQINEAALEKQEHLTKAITELTVIFKEARASRKRRDSERGS